MSVSVLLPPQTSALSVFIRFLREPKSAVVSASDTEATAGFKVNTSEISPPCANEPTRDLFSFESISDNNTADAYVRKKTHCSALLQEVTQHWRGCRAKVTTESVSFNPFTPQTTSCYPHSWDQRLLLYMIIYLSSQSISADH